MVSTLTTVCCVITLFVSLILPVLALILYARKKKGIWSAWLLGAAGFVVSQVVVRLPILTALGRNASFVAFAQSHLVIYGLGLAFTAALFELAGRLAAAKLLERKGLTWDRSVAAGMGHGGIEAMSLIGMSFIANLVYIFMLNSGTFDAMVAQAAAAGADTAQLEAVRDALVNTSSWMFLLAAVERLLTMVLHTAMSALVCFGVHRGKTLAASLGCLALHTLVDSSATVSMLLPKSQAYPIIYTCLGVLAVGAVFLLRTIRSRWEAESC